MHYIDFHLYEILEKGKNAKIRKNSSWQGLRERRGGLTAKRPEGT